MCWRPARAAALLALQLLALGTRAVGAMPRAASAPTIELASQVGGDGDVCCRREQHFIKVGVDAVGGDLVVDVGKCRRHCYHSGGISKKKFLKLLDDNADANPIELFRRHEARRASCRRPDSCQPLETTMERHYTLQGQVTSAVVWECGCVTPPASCERLARRVTFHPGGPHQRTVDVGACGGHCAGRGDECHPLRNKTVTIEGPNGAEVVQVVEECVCAHGCYRMSVMDQVYDYSDLEAVPRIKVVDVGRCVGACTKDQNGRDCVLSDPLQPSKCLMTLQYQRLGCVASGSQQHFYRTEDGQERAMLSVTNCSCH